MVESKGKGRKVFNILNLLLMTLVALICLLPFINLLATSFSSSTAVAAGEVAFWPKGFTTEAYKFALQGSGFLRSMGISFLRVILGVTVNLVLIVITAYPLSRPEGKVHGRTFYMIFFVITMLIGGGLIPTYLVVVKTGLINSLWSLIIPGALPVYNMIIFMNFMRELPYELEEAALIDGASPLQILTKIMLPLLRPALATVGLFCIVNHWNDWFSAMIYLNDSKMYPLQTYLQTLLLNFEEIMRRSGTNYAELLNLMNAQTGRAAQLFLGALPLMIVYPFLQKHFTAGLVLGSVKG